MKIKILLGGSLAVLIAGLSAFAVWRAMRPQVIIFSDDARLTLLKVEYGKRHAPPTARSTATRGRGRGAFTTTNDTLVAWVREQSDPKQYHYFQYFIYDKAETACVQTYGRSFSGGRPGNGIMAAQFNAFPRRQKKFYLRAEEQSTGGQEMSDARFVIRNPVRGPFASWTPEPLPDTKDADDLSVTLTKLVAEADILYQRNRDNANDAVNKGVQAVFHVERNGKPVANWQPVAVETTDATGNRVSGMVIPNWAGQPPNGWPQGDGTFTYQYALWLDEPAWKLRFEFSQQSDFSPGEFCIAPVPVQSGRQRDFFTYNPRRPTTNAPAVETDLNGFHLKIFPAMRFTDVGANAWMQAGLQIQVSPAMTAGWRMTVNVTDDQTNEIQHNDYGMFHDRNAVTCRYRLEDLSGLTNVNVTVALHRSRFVEFTVKPEKAPAAVAADQ